MKVWVGTSGYSYADWVGVLYPMGTSAKRMLAHYARVFPITELNFTFYGVPTPQVLTNQANQTPADFRFAVKLFQGMTHEGDLSMAPAFREAIDVLHGQGRLCALLAQFPQQFHWGRDTLAYIEQLAVSFAGYPLAVEFRHHSWTDVSVAGWLHARGLHFVSVDVPPIPGLFPSGLVLSSRLIYVRLHSRRTHSWYQGDKERYDYLYSDAEMQEWIGAIRDAREKADEAYVLFNNCHGAQAAINARRLQDLVRGDKELQLALPPEAPRTAETQAELF